MSEIIPDAEEELSAQPIRYFDEAERPITAEKLRAVFAGSGIRRPLEDIERLEKMLKHANLIIGAWSGDQLIGVARGWSDFSFCCYLSDLAVDRRWQRRGIGRRLMTMVRERVGEQVTVLLLAAPDAASYYARLGFEAVDNAWRLSRTR